MLLACAACRPSSDAGSLARPADLVLTGGRVYTLDWEEPAPDGAPAPSAPYEDGTPRPDAEAIAFSGGTISFVGSAAEAQALVGAGTRVVDVGGATVLPGFVDAHVHVADLGGRLEQIDLVGVADEAEAVARVAEAAAGVPAGEWILGWGWDEGAWADRYPTHEALSRAVPAHPVLLRGLHGFALWANAEALRRAGIDADTPTPSGGEIRRDAAGRPTGLFLNRATALFDAVVPAPDAARLRARVRRGLEAMAEAGYVAVHEAGADGSLMAALESLEREGRLPIRVYVMLSGRDPELLDAWSARGPDAVEGAGPDEYLITRAVKGHYDGALGSRGALLLEDYADAPGNRGTGSEGYGYDHDRIARLARRGFQPAIHAIGDRGNRETLDFLAGLFPTAAEVARLRPRIEHAQVVHADDFARFGRLGVIASMQPPHMAEDKAWAERRLGPDRIHGAYAWRTLRESGARLVFSSDLPGSDHAIPYGLHAAVTRRDRAGQPPAGWYPDEGLTPEEAVRGYTSWAAWAAGLEDRTGALALGRWGDVTVLDVDPLGTPAERYGEVLRGRVLLTVVAGRVVHEALPTRGASP